MIPNAASAPIWLAATIILLAVLGLIAIIDARSFRIPDALSLPLLAAGLALAWAAPGIFPSEPAFADHLIGAAGAFALLGLMGEIIFRRTGQEALGLGDAKLFGAAGAWLGWQALPMVLLIASASALVFALIRRRRQGVGAIAFGPWIALGFGIGWLSRTLG